MRIFQARDVFLAKPCLVSKGGLGLAQVLSALGEGFAEIIQRGHGHVYAIERISELELVKLCAVSHYPVKMIMLYVSYKALRRLLYAFRNISGQCPQFRLTLGAGRAPRFLEKSS